MAANVVGLKPTNTLQYLSRVFVPLAIIYFRINVCGELFITTFKSLEEFPKTLLGSPERERYFCPELNAYFFNRNRACFESILLFYQTGDEYPPLTADLDLWEEEKAFFR